MPDQEARSAAKDQDDFAGSAGPREHALRPFGDLTKDWPLTRRGRVKLRVLRLKWRLRRHT